MVIGFDGSRAFVLNKTGTENYSYQVLKALGKIDKKNSYIVYTRPDSVIPAKAGNHTNKTWIPDQVRDDNYGFPGNFQFSILNFQFFWTQGGLALQTFKDGLDVLFIPAHTLPLISKPGLKTVVTVHDLGSEYLPSMHQLKQRLYLSIMQKHQLKTASKIIAVSNTTKEDLMNRLGIDQEKIAVVHEGFDKKLFQPTNSDVLVNSLRQYDLQKGKYFLFVGTVQPRKNLERVIRAFATYLSLRASAKQSSTMKKIALSSLAPRNDGVELIIAGSKGWLSDEIYSLPKQLGIEDKVKFLGYVPDLKLPALYCGAKALIFTSLFEGFGLPILEAQACGCPVITSNVSSMPEVAGKGALFVDPYSIDDIVKGMERLQVTAYRLQLIKAGFENIKRFSWEKCAKETLKVLEDVSSR